MCKGCRKDFLQNIKFRTFVTNYQNKFQIAINDLYTKSYYRFGIYYFCYDNNR